MPFKRPRPALFSIAAWTLGTLALCAATCFAVPPPPHAPPPHILILSLDTTRADHLSLYGYPLHTTPHLDRFAREAVVFENARTVVPLTGPSHASLFTSQYPHRHGAFRNGIPLKGLSVPLPEHLRRHGYETAAFVSGWTLRGGLCGLDQGFDLYDDHIPHRYKLVNRERYAEETLHAVRAYLEARPPGDKPLFLFVHFFDPHDPYRPHPEFLRALKEASGALPAAIPAVDLEAILRYDSEIAYMDRHVGGLLDLLRAQGILEDAVIVILADHGESLGEHGYWGHGRRVYDPMLRIPLILLSTRQAHGHRRVRQPVSSLDVLPTILSLADLPPPPGIEMEGRDLSGFVRGGAALAHRRIYFETFRGTIKRFTKFLFKKMPDAPLLMGFEENGVKVILSPESSTMEIYDLAQDPQEENNLAGRDPPSLPPLVSHLESWYKNGLTTTGPVRATLSQEDIQQMKSLGYLN